MIKKPLAKQIEKKDGVLPKAQSFLIKSESNADSLIIIVHGFTSSPYHMHELAEFLARGGYDSKVVRLAGHGGSFDRLKNSNAKDWQGSLHKVIEENKKKYKKIFLVGFSFGANLSLHASTKHSSIKAVAALSIPIFLKKEKRIRFFLPLAKIFQERYKKRWIEEKNWPKLKERGHHSHIPIKGIVDFYNFIDKVSKKEMHKVTVPVLAVHSRADNVADASSSEFLYRNVSSKIKELYILNKTSHNLEYESRRDFIFNKILNFFDSF